MHGAVGLGQADLDRGLPLGGRRLNDRVPSAPSGQDLAARALELAGHQRPRRVAAHRVEAGELEVVEEVGVFGIEGHRLRRIPLAGVECRVADSGAIASVDVRLLVEAMGACLSFSEIESLASRLDGEFGCKTRESLPSGGSIRDAAEAWMLAASSRGHQQAARGLVLDELEEMSSGLMADHRRLSRQIRDLSMRRAKVDAYRTQLDAETTTVAPGRALPEGEP